MGSRGIASCAVLLLMLGSGSVFGAGRLQAQQIALIKVGSDGGITGQFASIHEDPDQCGGTRQHFYIDPSHVARKEMLALLLGAHHGGGRISVYVSGCRPSANPNDVWPIVVTMDVLN